MNKKWIVILLGFGLAMTGIASADTAGFIKVAAEAKGKSNTSANTKQIVYPTDSLAASAAAKLGYSKTNYVTKNGAAVFKKGNSYISRDVDGHNGGAWKEASSPEKLNSKATRNGTFDINMKRIGD